MGVGDKEQDLLLKFDKGQDLFLKIDKGQLAFLKIDKLHSTPLSGALGGRSGGGGESLSINVCKAKRKRY